MLDCGNGRAFNHLNDVRCRSVSHALRRHELWRLSSPLTFLHVTIILFSYGTIRNLIQLLVDLGLSEGDNSRHSDIDGVTVVFHRRYATGQSQSFDQHRGSDLHVDLAGIDG